MDNVSGYVKEGFRLIFEQIYSNGNKTRFYCDFRDYLIVSKRLCDCYNDYYNTNVEITKESYKSGIRQIAHKLWELRGCKINDDKKDWYYNNR